MDNNTNFRHLSFPQSISGHACFKRPNIQPSQQTANNIKNPRVHGNALKNQVSSLSRFWHSRREDFSKTHGNVILSHVPFLLEIDPAADVDFLRGLGFEIVCEIDNGFIIVASEDIDLQYFNKKLNDYIEVKTRSASPAKVYGLCEDKDRVKRILSPQLYDRLFNCQQKGEIIVDVYVECAGNQSEPDLPSPQKCESDEEYEKRIKKLKRDYQIKLDEISMSRETEIENFISVYQGELVTGYVSDGSSSFFFRLKISYDGLKDFVLNYPYIFEVREYDQIIMENNSEAPNQIDRTISIYPPTPGSPIVCVVDSGIQEMHKMLSASVLQNDSHSFIPNNPNAQDDVPNGGHGTRVAGAIQYGALEHTLDLSEYTLPCFLRNVKVLDALNSLPSNINQLEILEDIVSSFSVKAQQPTKIYNHSIGENRPFSDMTHMSAWAVKIDELSYENDLLFIQSAGNIPEEIIRSLIQSGHNYPLYFGNELTRISDPAQSLQALTVGSVSSSGFEDSDRIAMGKFNEISAFSRIGPGIWDCIKPDVVEYGGTYAVSKSIPPVLTTPNDVCMDLIRRSPEGPSHAKDGIGTSFSTPKVTRIAAEIQRHFPDSSALLYRALIVQSAKLPVDFSLLNDEQKKMIVRQMGYGIPNLSDAITGNEYRVTFFTNEDYVIGAGEAHIFPIQIPESMRSIGDDFDIRIEITLSYAAKPRQNRRYTKRYLSTWLDWKCSNKGETQANFQERIWKTDISIQDDGSFSWFIGEQSNWGQIKGFSRKNQTLQKDWCIIKSSQLSDAFCIAVRGHKGWGSLFKARYSLVVSFEAIEQTVPIYEDIRIQNTVQIENPVEEQRIEISEESSSI